MWPSGPEILFVFQDGRVWLQRGVCDGTDDDDDDDDNAEDHLEMQMSVLLDCFLGLHFDICGSS